MRIKWSPLAIERVSEIAEYIAKDNPISANKWALKIFDSVDILSDFPEIGRMIPEIQSKKFREIIEGNYRIIYKFENSIVSILSVYHGRQILPTDQIY